MGMSSNAFAGAMMASALLIYFSPGFLADYYGRASKAVKDALIWVGLALVLVGLYSYRTEFNNVANRVFGELAPPGSNIPLATNQGETQAVKLRRRPDGHFIANVQILGKSLPMIVDTGASTIVLKHEDAKVLGLDTSQLRYSIQVQTANGTAKTARTILDKVSVGPVAIQRVETLIAMPGALSQSLLGMSFLGQLNSYEFSGDFLTLRY